MRFNRKFFLLPLFLIVFITASRAQSTGDWLDIWQTPGMNFFTVKAAFDSAWRDREMAMLLERSHNEELDHHKRWHDLSIFRNGQPESENEELDGTYFQFKRWEYFMEPR